MDRTRLGRIGEDHAAGFLRARGWRILGRNVRQGRREVDIIASKGAVLAFIEVKCRRSAAHGHPMEAITPRKRRRIVQVAREWLRGTKLPPGTRIRFDAISVFHPKAGPVEIHHEPDAWRLE
jgi:putative endonuclease